MPPGLDRQAANDAAVRQFLATWDPYWRWTLVLGLRDLRANVDRLGRLATESTGQPEWSDEQYTFGPMALGLTAAAVNETAQHAEDLFALLTFIREPRQFVQRMAAYNAGAVMKVGRALADDSAARIRALFMVPTVEVVERGMAGAVDPSGSSAAVEQGVDRLVAMVRETSDWYLTHEFFHLQYKHGLKLPLSPFGDLPVSTVEQRRRNVSAPLIAFTNEPLAQTLRRPPSQRTVVIPDLGPTVRPHLAELTEGRDLLRYQMGGGDIDLDRVVEMSFAIARLLNIAGANRLALMEGLDDHAQQTFHLPGAGATETMRVSLQPEQPIELSSFQSVPRR